MAELPSPSGRPQSAWREQYASMPDGTGPATPSSDYKAMRDYWELSHDLIGGLPALRMAGEKYLPKFPKESPESHGRRVKNARLTNLFRKGVFDLSGRPFSKPAMLGEGIPPNVQAVLDNPDRQGSNLAEFSFRNFFKGVADGLSWIAVDRPAGGVQRIMSVAEARGGRQVYWRMYDPLDVIAAYSETDANGEEYLSEVRILERAIERENFKEKESQYVRVFRRQSNGIVTWERYKKIESRGTKGDEWAMETPETRLDISRIPLVPVVFGMREGMSWRVTPPLHDAAYLQIELYQQENGLKHISEMTGFPMIAANGLEPERGRDGNPKAVSVGPFSVLYGGRGLGESGAGGSWAILEPGGQSLRFLLQDKKETTRELESLMQKPLRDSPNLTVVEAASSTEESNNALQSWTKRLESGIEDAVSLTAEWLGIRDYDPSGIVEFHKDFEIGMGQTDMQTLLASATSDPPLISRETYLAELKRRGVLSASFDTEADLELLARVVNDGIE